MRRYLAKFGLWVMCVGWPVVLAAQPIESMDVPDHCTTIETGQDLFRVECRYTSITYVQGYVEGLQAFQVIGLFPPDWFCVDVGTRFEDIFLATAAWIAMDAERIQLPVRTGLALALRAVYPC